MGEHITYTVIIDDEEYTGTKSDMAKKMDVSPTFITSRYEAAYDLGITDKNERMQYAIEQKPFIKGTTKRRAQKRSATIEQRERLTKKIKPFRDRFLFRRMA